MAPSFSDSGNTREGQNDSSFNEKFHEKQEEQRRESRGVYLHQFVVEHLQTARQTFGNPPDTNTENMNRMEPAEMLRQSLQKGDSGRMQTVSKQLFNTVEDNPRIESLNEILMASWKQDTETVKKLVEKNYSLDVRDSTGRDPLAIAQVTGNRELQQFIENNSDQSFRM